MLQFFIPCETNKLTQTYFHTCGLRKANDRVIRNIGNIAYICKECIMLNEIRLFHDFRNT